MSEVIIGFLVGSIFGFVIYDIFLTEDLNFKADEINKILEDDHV